MKKKIQFIWFQFCQLQMSPWHATCQTKMLLSIIWLTGPGWVELCKSWWEKSKVGGALQISGKCIGFANQWYSKWVELTNQC